MMQYQAERLPEQLRSKVSGQGKERGSGDFVACRSVVTMQQC